MQLIAARQELYDQAQAADAAAAQASAPNLHLRPFSHAPSSTQFPTPIFELPTPSPNPPPSAIYWNRPNPELRAGIPRSCPQ